MSWRDVLIGVLVAYVVIDLMFSFSGQDPSMAQKLLTAAPSKDTLVALVVGVGVGVLAWWLSRRSHREYFGENRKRIA